MLPDCIALLLKHGADVRCTDHNGNTPMDLAKDEVTKNELYKALSHADLQTDTAGTRWGLSYCIKLCEIY